MKVWNWEGFWSYFTNLYLLEGALWTIGLTVSTLLLGGLIGLGLAVMRLSRHKALSRAAQGYIWVFRGTPLLVQLIIIYTGLPQLGLVRFSVLESAVIGLALNEAAYLSEILRGGILSVAKGQTEAARALGLRPFPIFRQIVLPQALRVIIPPLGNSVNGLLKTTSIASVISMEEVLRRGQILMQQKFQVLEVFMVVAIIYLAMTTCWDFVQRRIEAYYGKAYGAARLLDDTLPKPVRWDLSSFPEDVRRRMGGALWEAQIGRKAPWTKPLKGYRGAGVLEIVDDFDGDTFRAVYTVRFAKAIYVLHAFQKKSKRGRATPRTELDMVERRLKRAQEDYEQWSRSEPAEFR